DFLEHRCLRGSLGHMQCPGALPIGLIRVTPASSHNMFAYMMLLWFAQHSADVATRFIVLYSQAGRRVSVRIEIDDQGRNASRPSSRSQTQGYGSLANAALEAGNRDNLHYDC